MNRRGGSQAEPPQKCVGAEQLGKFEARVPASLSSPVKGMTEEVEPLQTASRVGYLVTPKTALSSCRAGGFTCGRVSGALQLRQQHITVPMCLLHHENMHCCMAAQPTCAGSSKEQRRPIGCAGALAIHQCAPLPCWSPAPRQTRSCPCTGWPGTCTARPSAIE